MTSKHPETKRATSQSPDSARRSERAHRAILTATRDLVAEVGYDRLTIEGIAKAAGVGKQTIYRWWPSKASVLFDALFEVSAQEDGRVILPDTGEIKTDLRHVLLETITELNKLANDRLQRAILAEVQTDIDVARALLGTLLRPQADAVHRRIQAAKDLEQVEQAADPDLVVELLFGPVVRRWALRTGNLDDAFVDGIIDLVCTGIQPR